MADTLALEKLYADVGARFTAEGHPAAGSLRFGWREPARQGGAANRIVWVPGDDESGDVGELAPPKYPGRIPARPLATLQDLFTIYVVGHDATDRSELAQWKATRLLFDDLYRAIYLAAHGTFQILKAQWKIDLKEARYGNAIRVLGTVESMIPDAQVPSAPVDTSALIHVTHNSLVEDVTAP